MPLVDLRVRHRRLGRPHVDRPGGTPTPLLNRRTTGVRTLGAGRQYRRMVTWLPIAMCGWASASSQRSSATIDACGIEMQPAV